MSASPIGSVYSTPRLCLPCGRDFVPERKVDRRLVAEYCSDACRLKATRAGLAGVTKQPGHVESRQDDIFDAFEARARAIAQEQAPTRAAVRPRPPRKLRAPVIPPTAPAYARNIVAERLTRNWSRQTLAERAGTWANAIAYWETGQREPTVAQFAAIAGAFGVSLDDLWGERL